MKYNRTTAEHSKTTAEGRHNYSMMLMRLWNTFCGSALAGWRDLSQLCMWRSQTVVVPPAVVCYAHDAADQRADWPCCLHRKLKACVSLSYFLCSSLSSEAETDYRWHGNQRKPSENWRKPVSCDRGAHVRGTCLRHTKTGNLQRK